MYAAVVVAGEKSMHRVCGGGDECIMYEVYSRRWHQVICMQDVCGGSGYMYAGCMWRWCRERKHVCCLYVAVPVAEACM